MIDGAATARETIVQQVAAAYLYNMGTTDQHRTCIRAWRARFKRARTI
ncbi:MAG: hypothetical protein HOC74_35320 [Gemmatimonadetes bacterium]|nr:hypothetical protein [Gemmatimonadota bacterium]